MFMRSEDLSTFTPLQSTTMRQVLTVSTAVAAPLCW